MTPMLDDLAQHLDEEERRTGSQLAELLMPPTYIAMVAAEFGLPYETDDYLSLRLSGDRYLAVMPATVH